MCIPAATYGANCGPETADITKVCRSSRDHRVNVDTFRHPAPGSRKSYYLKYQCGATGPRTAFVLGEAGLGSLILLSCH